MKCFVVMGFGTKTDYQQQKTFDLDKTYRIIIKRAVEAAGLECIRADDVMHAGVIDKPMYELLLEADLVIADLSTCNLNAVYELGVRHALRPNTTIVIAEEGFSFPFDLKSVLIRQYRHLGEGIDAEDAEAMRDALKAAIEDLVGQNQVDSPVYTFLPDLNQPDRGEREMRVDTGDADASDRSDAGVELLMEMYQEAISKPAWDEAKPLLNKLKERLPGDAYIIQQLALATYKNTSGEPGDEAGKKAFQLAALAQAKYILAELKPTTSNDPETLGLYGAIHKRLWEVGADPADLEESIRSYGKGFHLKDDHYNGINYAYMLNVRAAQTRGPEAVADFVWAKRVRERVIELCEQRIATGDSHGRWRREPEALFWLRGTLTEAFLGTGRNEQAEAMLRTANAEAPQSWMSASLAEQLEKLEAMLANPPAGAEAA